MLPVCHSPTADQLRPDLSPGVDPLSGYRPLDGGLFPGELSGSGAVQYPHHPPDPHSFDALSPTGKRNAPSKEPLDAGSGCPVSGADGDHDGSGRADAVLLWRQPPGPAGPAHVLGQHSGPDGAAGLGRGLGGPPPEMALPGSGAGPDHRGAALYAVGSQPAGAPAAVYAGPRGRMGQPMAGVSAGRPAVFALRGDLAGQCPAGLAQRPQP